MGNNTSLLAHYAMLPRSPVWHHKRYSQLHDCQRGPEHYEPLLFTRVPCRLHTNCFVWGCWRTCNVFCDTCLVQVPISAVQEI
jgi:hypothetical protein